VTPLVIKSAHPLVQFHKRWYLTTTKGSSWRGYPVFRDICSFTRSFMWVLTKALACMVLVASAIFGATIDAWFMYSDIGMKVTAWPSVTMQLVAALGLGTLLLAVSILIIAVGALIFAGLEKLWEGYYKPWRRQQREARQQLLDSQPYVRRESSLVSQMWRAHKDKYCVPIKFE
jgi:hypothetical protein